MVATNGHDTLHIPVIDISKSNEQTGCDLVDAVVQYGFVFIKSSGPGLDAETIKQMFYIVSSDSASDRDVSTTLMCLKSQQFFQCPQEEKQKFRMEKNVALSNLLKRDPISYAT